MSVSVPLRCTASALLIFALSAFPVYATPVKKGKIRIAVKGFSIEGHGNAFCYSARDIVAEEIFKNESFSLFEMLPVEGKDGPVGVGGLQGEENFKKVDGYIIGRVSSAGGNRPLTGPFPIIIDYVDSRKGKTVLSLKGKVRGAGEMEDFLRSSVSSIEKYYKKKVNDYRSTVSLLYNRCRAMGDMTGGTRKGHGMSLIWSVVPGGWGRFSLDYNGGFLSMESKNAHVDSLHIFSSAMHLGYMLFDSPSFGIKMAAGPGWMASRAAFRYSSGGTSPNKWYHHIYGEGGAAFLFRLFNGVELTCMPIYRFFNEKNNKGHLLQFLAGVTYKI